MDYVTLGIHFDVMSVRT